MPLISTGRIKPTKIGGGSSKTNPATPGTVYLSPIEAGDAVPPRLFGNPTSVTISPLPHIDANVHITGVHGTTNVGTFDNTIGQGIIVGVQGIGHVGTFEFNSSNFFSVNLSGVFGTSQVGALVFVESSSVGLSGVFGTGETNDDVTLDIVDSGPPPDKTAFRNISGSATGQGRSISSAGSEAAGNSNDTGAPFYWSEAFGYEDIPIIDPSGVTYFGALSADGSTVAGHYQNSDGTIQFPYYWTHSGGIITTTIPGPYNRAFVIGCNTTGTLIAGYLVDDGGGTVVPFIWDINASITVLPAYLGAPDNHTVLFSDDGTTLAGNSNNGVDAWVWTSGAGYVSIPNPGGIDRLALASISVDGNFIAGSTVASFITIHGFVWTRIGGLVDVGTLAGHEVSTLFDICDDGSKAVGYSINGDATEQLAVIWDGATLTSLGSFGPNEFGNIATQCACISGDGSTIGIIGNVSEFSNANQSILWKSGPGLIDLETPVVVLGVTIRVPDGWIFGFPQITNGMNIDGTRWVGNAFISGPGFKPTVWYADQTFDIW